MEDLPDRGRLPIAGAASGLWFREHRAQGLECDDDPHILLPLRGDTGNWIFRNVARMIVRCRAPRHGVALL